MQSSHFRTILLPLALALVACEKSEPPPPPNLTLEEIAAAWSGGRTDPTCLPHGPRGEYLLPGSEHCQWPTVSRGGQWGTVTGSRDTLLGLTSLMWMRTVPDTAAALQLADSLGAEFTQLGLAAYACPGDGRRWQKAGMWVQFNLYPERADERLRTSVTVSVVGPLPDLMCPGVPAVTPPDPHREALVAPGAGSHMDRRG